MPWVHFGFDLDSLKSTTVLFISLNCFQLNSFSEIRNGEKKFRSLENLATSHQLHEQAKQHLT